MTSEQREEQHISFAYGNANLSDQSITRADVTAASKLLKESPDGESPGGDRQPARER